MATAISVDNFKAALGECYDAIESGDIALARKWYAKAEAQNAGLLTESSVDGMTQKRREGLDALAKALTVAEAAAAPAATNRALFTEARGNL